MPAWLRHLFNIFKNSSGQKNGQSTAGPDNGSYYVNSGNGGTGIQGQPGFHHGGYHGVGSACSGGGSSCGGSGGNCGGGGGGCGGGD